MPKTSRPRTSRPRTSRPRTSSQGKPASNRTSAPSIPATDAPPERRITYQGEPGANSHLACKAAFPELVPVASATFEDALMAVKNGEARYAMIPIENSVAGRVADIHHLLPEIGLYIVGEHFERIRHQLMALPGTSLADIKTAHSHTQALGQCRRTLRNLGITPIPEADTAGAARHVAQWGDPSRGAIASTLAAEVYGLEIIKPDIEDEAHNTTRFVVFAAEPDDAEPEDGAIVTTFIFRVRSVPAALYKALGGFATNGVNMTKLESYQLEGTFSAAMFFADIEGHPAQPHVRLAMEELSFFSNELRILGSYVASPYRAEAMKRSQPPAAVFAGK